MAGDGRGLPAVGSPEAYAHCNNNDACRKAVDLYLDARQRGWVNPYYVKQLRDVPGLAPPLDSKDYRLYEPLVRLTGESLQRCFAEPACQTFYMWKTAPTQEVVAKHGIAEEKLLGRSQWREITTIRKEAIYRIWKEAKAGVSEIGRLFNRTPSAVSQLIRSVEMAPLAD